MSDSASVRMPALRSPVVMHEVWVHRFGSMLIERCADGSVWIDGRPVVNTLPAGDAQGDTQGDEQSDARDDTPGGAPDETPATPAAAAGTSCDLTGASSDE